MTSDNDLPTSPLIDTTELAELLDDPRLRLFDVRGVWNGDPDQARADYLDRHIPRAMHLDWTTHFVEPDTSIDQAAVATADGARRSFETLGITADSIVVVYDNYHHMLAGRVWWAMRYWGLANVRVLNGGLRAWRAEDRPEAAGDEVFPLGQFAPSQCPDLRTSTDQLVAVVDTVTLFDARGAAGYNGVPGDPRTGHIPGARHLAFDEMLDSVTGRFRDKASLQLAIDERRGSSSGPLVTSCGSGYAATVLLLAMAHLGLEASLHDDSFTGWVADETRSVERDRTALRRSAVAATMDRIRAVEGEHGVSQYALSQIEAELTELSKHGELFDLELFPAPAAADERDSHVYRLSEDADGRFALYLEATDGHASTKPHNHTTWACIVGLIGQEVNQFYDRTDDGGVVKTSTAVVEAGSGVTMLPDDVHAIFIEGKALVFHCYGLALDRLVDREFYDSETHRWVNNGGPRQILDAR